MNDVAIRETVRQAKVVPPRLPPRLLPRPQLTRELQQALSVRVTLVIAGAGYGKSTMIAQAMEELQGKRGGPVVSWLQLDEYDVNRVAFFNALVASMEHSVPTFFQKWRSQLAVMNTAEFAQRFSDELGAINREVVLVIEDIHWLIRGEKEAYNALSPIIESLPNNVHVILTSRKVLMMECAARMRARQQLLIIGKEKLTMSVEEVRRLLHDVYQEDVPDDLVRRIAAQVEGWVTGIVLLLQARYVLEIQAWDSFLGLISGDSHEFFFAYFMSEVYERLSENMRRCLRLVAELPEWDVKAVKEVYGDEVTRELARYVSDENALFVFPVDDRRTRFRFHPMFREFLRAQGPVGEEMLRQLGEHEFTLKNHRVAAMLFRESKSWQRMLEAMYQLIFVTRNYAVAPSELRELLEAVPGETRHTFDAWWVMRAAQLLHSGEVAEVCKLPCNYKKFKEPYKTKYLGLYAQAVRNSGKPGEAVKMLTPIVEKHLRKPDRFFTREIVALVVNYAIALIDISSFELAKEAVQWLEQRKLVAPDSDDDDRIYGVLRAYYNAVGNFELANNYSQKQIAFVKKYKIFLLPDVLLNCGCLYLDREYLKEGEEILREGLDMSRELEQQPIELAYFAELAHVYLKAGDIAKSKEYFSKIPENVFSGNPLMENVHSFVKAEIVVGERRVADASLLYQIIESYERTKDIYYLFTLAWMHRRFQSSRRNVYLHEQIEAIQSAESGIPVLLKLLVDSENKRHDESMTLEWEKTVGIFIRSQEVDSHEAGFSTSFVLFEIIEKFPEHAAAILSKCFRHGRYLVLSYLQNDWNRISTSSKAILIEFLAGKISTKHIARGLFLLLSNFDVEQEIVEQTRIVELISKSEFLSEDEIGPILLKYRSVASSAEEALRQYGNRDPEGLTVRMLGKFEITKGEKRIEFPKEVTQPMISVLKLLLRKRDEVITLDTIADTIWKDIGSKQAKNNVYAAISQLRTALEPFLLSGKDSHFIKAVDRGYLFTYRIVDTIDVEEFESLVAASSKQRGEKAAQTLISAAKLYRGKYLEENQYDEWADNDRDRIQQMYLKALETIVAWYRKVNAWDEVETYGTRGFALEPENEDFCAALMECASARREMYSLKRVFADHQNAKNEMFGEVPSKGIQDLYQTCLDKL